MQPQNQQQNWYTNKQMMMSRQNSMHNMQNYETGPYGQRPRAPQMMNQNNNYQGVFLNDQQQQQYGLSQGMKMPNVQQQHGGVLSQQLQQQQGMNANVMGPPTPQHSIQQQLMQSVCSPPPIRSPQLQLTARPSPSPRSQPSASPRPQPSPHHLSSHSPAPGDPHNHMHPHPSPVGPNDQMGPGNDSTPLTAQDQLTKVVEQL